MSGFLLGFVVGVLINLTTALFSRQKALRLIPPLTFYLLSHGSYVVLNTRAVLRFCMDATRQYPPWATYSVVMLIGAALAAAYWRLSVASGAALDTVTSPAAAPARVPTADEIAEAISRRSEPSVIEKARRHRLRRDLTQYLTRGTIERDTFRILLQPTVDEKGNRVDQTDKIGEAMLRIQEWNTEVTFYLQSRLGEDRALWIMNKPPSDRYPSNIGDAPALSQSWDNVVGGVQKLEQLLADFPELPGGAEAAAKVEADWKPAEGLVTWTQKTDEEKEGGVTARLKVTLVPARDLDGAIVEIRFSSPLGGMPEVEFGSPPIFLGNKRISSPDTYHFEVLRKWSAGRSVSLVVPGNPDLSVRDVLLRLW